MTIPAPAITFSSVRIVSLLTRVTRFVGLELELTQRPFCPLTLAATSAKPWVAKSTEGRAPTTLQIFHRHQVVARREDRRSESRVNPIPALEQ